MSAQNDPQEDFDAGKVALYFPGNLDKWSDMYKDLENGDWKSDSFPIGINRFYHAILQNRICVPIQCKDRVLLQLFKDHVG